MKRKEMFNKMIKCQKSRYWAENLIIDAISNWIKTKYNEEPSVRLLEYNFIKIFFSDTNREKHDEIVQDVCKEFELEMKYEKIGCAKHYGPDGLHTTRFHSYELTRGVKNE